MKNLSSSKVLRFVPLIAAVLAVLALLLPSMTITVNDVDANVNLVWLFANTSRALLGFLVVLVILVVAGGVLLVFEKEKLAKVGLALLAFTGVSSIFIPEVFEAVKGIESEHFVGIILSTTLIFVGLFIGLRHIFAKVTFTAREMMEIAILVGLAVILDFIKVFQNPGGGSINLSMLPLFLIALRYNFTKSFIASGIIYGFIAVIKDGYGFATYPFDYLIGYGLIAIVSLFRHLVFNNKLHIALRFTILIGAFILAGFGRLVGSTLSSMVLYSYSLQAALVYNLAYIPASTGLALVVTLALYPALVTINKRFPVDNLL